MNAGLKVLQLLLTTTSLSSTRSYQSITMTNWTLLLHFLQRKYFILVKDKRCYHNDLESNNTLNMINVTLVEL